MWNSYSSRCTCSLYTPDVYIDWYFVTSKLGIYTFNLTTDCQLLKIYLLNFLVSVYNQSNVIFINVFVCKELKFDDWIFKRWSTCTQEKSLYVCNSSTHSVYITLCLNIMFVEYMY